MALPRYLTSGFANVLGVVDAVTPGHAFETVRQNIRNPNYDMYGTPLGQDPNKVVSSIGGMNYNFAGDPIGGSFAQQTQGLSSPSGGVVGGGARTGGGAAGGGAQTAAQQAQIGGLRNEIIARRERANSIFDALTGAVSALAQEKRGQLESQFQQEQTRATEDFTTKGDELSRIYAARGLGDSSYRVNALDKASQEYQRAIQDLGQQKQTGLAKVGSEAAGAQARIGADKGALGAIRLDEVGRKPDGTYDVNALVELRNNLDERIRNAEVQQTQFGTEAGFRGQLNQIAPYGGTVDALKSALTSLAQSAAPTVVKDRIATALIGNYAPQEGGVWQNFYDEESRKVASPTSVA